MEKKCPCRSSRRHRYDEAGLSHRREIAERFSLSQGRQFAGEDASEGASCNSHQRQQRRYDGNRAELSCGLESAEGSSHSLARHVTGERAIEGASRSSYQKRQHPCDEVELCYRQEDAERFSHSQGRYNTDGEAIEGASRSSHQRRQHRKSPERRRHSKYVYHHHGHSRHGYDKGHRHSKRHTESKRWKHRQSSSSDDSSSSDSSRSRSSSTDTSADLGREKGGIPGHIDMFQVGSIDSRRGIGQTSTSRRIPLRQRQNMTDCLPCVLRINMVTLRSYQKV